MLNPRFVHCQLGKLSFFCPLEDIVIHSQYYARASEEILNETGKQLVVDLVPEDGQPDNLFAIKASSLLVVLTYISRDEGQVLDTDSMTLYQARNVLLVCVALRLESL